MSQTPTPTPLTYRDAGVDIDAGEALVLEVPQLRLPELEEVDPVTRSGPRIAMLSVPTCRSRA